MRLIITCRMSKNNKEYLALILQNGDKETFISFDISIMTKISGTTPRTLYQLNVDEEIVIMEN